MRNSRPDAYSGDEIALRKQIHEDDSQRDTPDTDKNVVEQTAVQTVLEHM